MDTLPVQTLPQCLVMVHNLQKRHNIGPLIRSAVAFGSSEIVLVGQKKMQTFGNQGTNRFIRFSHHDTLEEAQAALHARGVCIVGVEITDDAVSVATHPFRGSTAFLLGNEGVGLSEREKRICDMFVFIPQYGQGTASLNVTVAAGIVLHHFALWAQYPEQGRSGEKFIVDDSAAVSSGRPSIVSTSTRVRHAAEEAVDGSIFLDENEAECDGEST